ncbi:MAG: diguanylate cyclase, partial [Abitibacteriaceae bacterium]|nr:diguanylate cyclase [Abditibacteriaceae bacterium]
MSTPLSVLILEDYAPDMQLMVYELRQAGFELKWQHVDNRDDYLAQLNCDYDLILADYSLPGFDALSALQLLQERDLDIPFIIVTGSISEEVAVACMKQGAADYLLKDRLGRLGQAVSQALESKRRRQEKKQADVALQQATDQLRAVLDAVPGGVSWVSSDLKYLGINRYLISTFHLTPEEFIGQRIGFLQCSPSFAEFARQVFEAPERSAYKEVEITVDGTSRQYLFMAQKYAGGQAAVFVGVDITERKHAERQLLHDAFYDKLTERPNRALFMDRLQQAIVRTKRHKRYQFAVLFLDLDRFKNVNDSLGHMAGDQLLVIISRRLEQCVRPIDTVARIGGDEFAILLDGIKDINDATVVAERIHRELRSPLNLEGHEVFTNASIGIAMSASGYEQPEDVLRDADTAMYRAKTLGKGRHEVFDAAMREQAVSL